MNAVLSDRLRTALELADHDQIIFDLGGIEAAYGALTEELPEIAVRFAIKSCPVNGVLASLAGRGSGFDAASPQEIIQALETGVAPERVHYGNTVKSDQNIAEAYRLGIRDFATDSVPDVVAIAASAPGSRVFCRLGTTGEGALWGLNRKAGCSVRDALIVLSIARAQGLVPSGLSVHVGSQQMTSAAWESAFSQLAEAMTELADLDIHIDRINLGGGLPALGYLDRAGTALDPSLAEIFGTIRTGMKRLQEIAGTAIEFVMEPGRHLVGDYGAIRAHVVRLSSRQQPDGARERWLYLSCGKFNGLYEVDQVRYRMVFPTHPEGLRVPAVVAGPTCDSDDVFGQEPSPARVPATIGSGDPVWILSCGAYSTSYTTQRFNGFEPLPVTVLPVVGLPVEIHA
ncbi:type III PLP-dependent enzyme [Kribbella albertanoniae]|uniref:ornithine decarboxylase n=1 Tax=Kribbella albertanoniae TaxID=1266829 RepID=A0A4R4PU98_9ACTN|nr:type III PLP-dependent enzyme [Kribbella albertanoniae]TDC25934.1 type III PLP-dependent enzyme [Kribbella albertanoniae]